MTAHAALSQTPQKQGTGTITGRVMRGDKGMANITVALYPSERNLRERAAVARGTTDYEGRYRLMNVPAGRYNIVAIAPAFVAPSDGFFGELGKFVTVAENETIEKMDIALMRGGVITGRITDADGAPVIGERVNLLSTDKQSRGRSFGSFNPYMHQTDDRGVYRLYGIPPGRYTVSIGESAEEGATRFGYGRRGYYTRTFYPGVTEEAKATIIEVTEGGETLNVDFTLGRKAQTFTATGRAVDASGKPLAGVHIGHGAIMKDNNMGGYGWGSTSDAQGRFRLEGLSPGRYAAFIWNEGDRDDYSEPVMFEITEGDISGLELKTRRGSSISGVVVIEGTTDRRVLAKLSEFSIGATPSEPRQGSSGAPNFSNAKLAPDGSFRLKGLRSGKFKLYFSVYPPPKGFSLARVERDGVAQSEIEVAEGAQITGVRVVLEYGTGIIRGVVKVENGTISEGLRMSVGARRAGESMPVNRGAQVDARGHYVLEGLQTGQYELFLYVYMVAGKPVRMSPIKQTVSVVNDVETEANFTVDLNAAQREGGNND